MKIELAKWVALAIAYVLASPVYFVKWLVGLPKKLTGMRNIIAGFTPCPYCGSANTLTRMAQCATCHAVEPASILRCRWCKTRFETATCEGCGATIRVP